MNPFLRCRLFLPCAVRFFSSVRRLTLTTPIFYVNGPPHLGHFSSALLADASARFLRLYYPDSQVSLFTGTDEHGVKVSEAAARAGLAPQQFCDKISNSFRTLFQRSGILFTDFIRTTEPRHHSVVSSVWRRLLSSGLISLGRHSGFYCKSEETFVPLNQLTFKNEKGEILVNPPNPSEFPTARAFLSDGGQPCDFLSEANYKFHLAAFQSRLIDYYEKHPSSIIPQSQYNAVLNSLKSGPLEDLSVSRPAARVSWGIPVPDDESHTIYVWLDALVNYLTVTGALETGKMPPLWPATAQFIGKDILRFHCVYWPAFLMALELPLPETIISHAHWLVDGRKMSKSLGNIVDPHALIDEFGLDASRYFLLRDLGLADDNMFSKRDMLKRLNSELNNTLGNLLSRSIATALLPDSIIPDYLLSYENAGPGAQTARLNSPEFHQETHGDLLNLLDSLAPAVADCFLSYRFSSGLQLIINALSRANQLFNTEKPWVAAKEGNKEKVHVTIYCCLEAVRIAALLMQPAIPQAADRILNQLRVPQDDRLWQHAKPGRLRGQKILDNQPVFTRIKMEEEKQIPTRKPAKIERKTV